MDAVSYRKLQLEATLGNVGTSELEILPVVLWSVAGLFFYNKAIHHRVQRWSITCQIIIEFTFLLFPQMFLFLFPQYSWWLLSTFIVGGLFFVPPPGLRKKLPSDKLNFMTSSRAIVTLMCVIGILAVDFEAFPRRFSKTESFGVSLMDVGVGCVVSMMGVMVGRQKESPSFYSSVKSTIPLLILGIARIIFIEIFDYQKVVSEYGVHWNFFFTLGTLPILLSAVYLVIPRRWSLVTGFILGCFYQGILLFSGLQEYLFSDDRIGLVAMNKGGIFSIFGYLSLLLMSVGVGQIIFTRREEKTHRYLYALLVSLISIYCVVKGSILPSRRIANFPFQIGSLSLTLLVILVNSYLEDSFSMNKVPLIYESISRNQLAYFLIGNLLTGLVNLSCQTLLQPTLIAFIILSAYLLILSIIIVALHKNNINLRL